MLTIHEPAPSNITHDFTLDSVLIDTRLSFRLSSDTYPAVYFNFRLEYDKHRIYPGFNVDVHLFKNTFFNNSDIVDLRIDGLTPNSGRVGYFFRLDALLQPDQLNITVHEFSYAYYGLEFLLSRNSKLQTSDVEYDGNILPLTDFFDSDTIVLVICKEYVQPIDNFTIDNYYSQLFRYGFIPYGYSNSIDAFNRSQLIGDNYARMRGDGLVCRIERANALLNHEEFVKSLFGKLISKNNEIATRFIMIYQIVEILISRIFRLEIQNTVCNDLANINSVKLKDLLHNVQKEKKRITWLLSKYTVRNQTIEKELRAELLSFFVHVNDPEYRDETITADYTFEDIFYDYRNKLVHNYRLIHRQGVDYDNTQQLMHNINQHSEVFVANLVSSFHVGIANNGI